MKKAKKILLYLAAWLFLIIGILGIFLPLVPTTGPVILASLCFMKSSQRMHDWLLQHPTLGPPIQSFLHERAMTIRAKVLAISSIWLSIMLSVIFFTSSIYLRIFLISLALALTVYLMLFKTLRPKYEGQEDENT